MLEHYFGFFDAQYGDLLVLHTFMLDLTFATRWLQRCIFTDDSLGVSMEIGIFRSVLYMYKVAKSTLN